MLIFKNTYLYITAIDGYIKTKFVLTPSRFENASYGCGSITDGEYKITVRIVNYTPMTIQKGVAVNVIGEVNTNKSEYYYYHYYVIKSFLNIYYF